MKNQSGKSPLGWIIVLVVLLIIAGISVAMIFGGTDIIPNLIEKIQNIIKR